ncbi:hypothetical protein [Spiroplasma taiwanense]|uniref:hypothetical protein n=1 Tax=Spiroplasma taiwanense TaxID=2145 RepID=UPI001F474D6A|nr:hypothetical protein [Spiroplasma taiwanense]
MSYCNNNSGLSENSFLSMSHTGKIIVQVAVSTLYLMLGISCWALVTNRWATIYEIKVSQKEYAASVGFISCIAFSPDAWFWQIDSILLKKYETEAGYATNKFANQISLSVITIIGILAAIAGIISVICLKREKANEVKLRNIIK